MWSFDESGFVTIEEHAFSGQSNTKKILSTENWLILSCALLSLFLSRLLCNFSGISLVGTIREYPMA